MKVKEENEKTGLKLNIQKKPTKTKIMAFGPITSWETEGEKVEGWKVLFSWVLKSVWTATEPWNQKTLAPWKES